MGLSVSDAIRLLMRRVADERRLPFEVKVPNATTRQAIGELEAANQRLRRAIMDENGGGAALGICAVRITLAIRHAIFMAANQHLRRAIIDENHVCPGVGGMREMHKAAAGHSIFVAGKGKRLAGVGTRQALPSPK